MTTAASDEWKSALVRAVTDGRSSNPAVRTLVDDFVRFHAVMAAMASLLGLALLFASVGRLRSYRRTRRLAVPGDRFERRVQIGFAGFFATFGALCCVIALANASTAWEPETGLVGAIELSSTPATGAVGRQALDWVNSGSPRIPPAIAAAVDTRHSWQRPKAIVCGVLSMLMVLLSTRQWRRMVHNARLPRRNRALKRTASMANGIGSVCLTTLLIVMAVANTQASIAPLTLSIFGGS
jgi:hypothetical protein